MRKITIEDIQNSVKKKGGKCLASEYVSSVAKVEWECSEGHRWFATINSVKNNDSWCPLCSPTKRLTLDDVKKLAESRGGKCLATVYRNNYSKLEWECSEGHRWLARTNSIKDGSWCPMCSKVAPVTMAELNIIAENWGGKCISTSVINSSTNLEWECSEGHRWFAPPSRIKNSGSWCPECRGTKKLTLEEMQDLAESRGGKCLSDVYVNVNTKMEWECKEGHKWSALPYAIKLGGWCPHCSKYKKLSLEEVRNSAAARGGKCLSKEYINAHTKMEWECEEGHRWFATAANVNRGTWCRLCGYIRKSK